MKLKHAVRFTALLLASALVFALVGCGKTPEPGDGSDRLNVVCTLFPQYDFGPRTEREARPAHVGATRGRSLHAISAFFPAPHRGSQNLVSFQLQLRSVRTILYISTG